MKLIPQPAFPYTELYNYHYLQEVCIALEHVIILSWVLIYRRNSVVLVKVKQMQTSRNVNICVTKASYKKAVDFVFTFMKIKNRRINMQNTS